MPATRPRFNPVLFTRASRKRSPICEDFHSGSLTTRTNHRMDLVPEMLRRVPLADGGRALRLYLLSWPSIWKLAEEDYDLKHEIEMFYKYHGFVRRFASEFIEKVLFLVYLVSSLSINMSDIWTGTTTTGGVCLP